MSVSLEHLMSPQRLIHVMKHTYIGNIIKATIMNQASFNQQLFRVLDTSFRHRYAASLLVTFEIIIPQGSNQLIC